VLGHDERHQALEHRHFDFLAFARAFAMEEGGEHRIHHGEGGRLVGHDGRQIPRLSAHHVLQHRDAARGLDRIVVGGAVRVGPLPGVAVGSAEDDARIHLAHRLVVEAEPGQGGGAVVVDEDVDVLRELQQGVLARRLLEIENQAPLVAVAGEEERRHARVPRRAELAVAVARGRLHLHHFGPEVAQDLAGPGAEDDARQFEDANAIEGTGHGLSLRAENLNAGRNCHKTITIQNVFLNDASPCLTKCPRLMTIALDL
jgi:hypothetical protein